MELLRSNDLPKAGLDSYFSGEYTRSSLENLIKNRLSSFTLEAVTNNQILEDQKITIELIYRTSNSLENNEGNYTHLGQNYKNFIANIWNTSFSLEKDQKITFEDLTDELLLVFYLALCEVETKYKDYLFRQSQSQEINTLQKQKNDHKEAVTIPEQQPQGGREQRKSSESRELKKVIRDKVINAFRDIDNELAGINISDLKKLSEELLKQKEQLEMGEMAVTNYESIRPVLVNLWKVYNLNKIKATSDEKITIKKLLNTYFWLEELVTEESVIGEDIIATDKRSFKTFRENFKKGIVNFASLAAKRARESYHIGQLGTLSPDMQAPSNKKSRLLNTILEGAASMARKNTKLDPKGETQRLQDLINNLNTSKNSIDELQIQLRDFEKYIINNPDSANVRNKDMAIKEELSKFISKTSSDLKMYRLRLPNNLDLKALFDRYSTLYVENKVSLNDPKNEEKILNYLFGPITLDRGSLDDKYVTDIKSTKKLLRYISEYILSTTIKIFELRLEHVNDN